VAGIENETSIFKDGQLVEIEGASGIVAILALFEGGKPNGRCDSIDRRVDGRKTVICR